MPAPAVIRTVSPRASLASAERAKRHRADQRAAWWRPRSPGRRHRDEPAGVGHHVVGVGVLEQDRHPGPGQGGIGLRADLLDQADHVAGQGAGQRAVVDRAREGLAPELDVDVVDADRLGADQHLSAAGLGDAGLLGDQDLGSSVRVITHASHEQSS